jgi:hypothetical protein
MLVENFTMTKNIDKLKKAIFVSIKNEVIAI